MLFNAGILISIVDQTQDDASKKLNGIYKTAVNALPEPLPEDELGTPAATEAVQAGFLLRVEVNGEKKSFNQLAEKRMRRITGRLTKTEPRGTFRLQGGGSAGDVGGNQNNAVQQGVVSRIRPEWGSPHL